MLNISFTVPFYNFTCFLCGNFSICNHMRIDFELFNRFNIFRRHEFVASGPRGVPTEGVLGHVLQKAREKSV